MFQVRVCNNSKQTNQYVEQPIISELNAIRARLHPPHLKENSGLIDPEPDPDSFLIEERAL